MDKFTVVITGDTKKRKAHKVESFKNDKPISSREENVELFYQLRHAVQMIQFSLIKGDEGGMKDVKRSK